MSVSDAVDGVRRPTIAVSRGRVAVLILACVQATSPLLFQLTGSSALDENQVGEIAIVPAGYAFSIWGLVCVAGVVYGVWQLRVGHRSDEVKDALTIPMGVAFSGFVLWLAAAASPWSALTVPIFAVMLGALVVALRRLHLLPRSASLTRWGRVLTATMVGVFAGWTSAAVWVNLATVIAAHWPTEEWIAWCGQTAILAGATATLCAIAAKTGAQVPYELAGAWALVGVAVGSASAGVPSLAGIAAAGLAVFVFVCFRTRRRNAGEAGQS